MRSDIRSCGDCHQSCISLCCGLCTISQPWSGRSRSRRLCSRHSSTWISSLAQRQDANNGRSRPPKIAIISTSCEGFCYIRGQVHITDITKLKSSTCSAFRSIFNVFFLSRRSLTEYSVSFFSNQGWFQFNDEAVTKIESLIPKLDTTKKGGKMTLKETKK